ncbi:glycosyltransferase [Candidatus Woesearchaeota archaeon]|nr:glycosyltransferase [Candidatus Woesearchaeota archaeon]
MVKPVIWIGTPSPVLVHCLDQWNDALVIYDCYDEIALFHNKQHAIIKAEKTLVARADIVLATAQRLYDRMRDLNPRTYLLPNGADVSHFARNLDQLVSPPADIESVPHPVIGYVGGIADWFDLDLIEAIARCRPKWSFVLIGQNDMSLKRQGVVENIHFLGQKKYQHLPDYIACFDVCLIPFKINAITESVSPIKLYEYLATGKPVVSSDLPEVRQYADLVAIAEGPRDFELAIERLLATPQSRAVQEARLRVAQANSWERRVDDVTMWIDQLRGVNRERTVL